MTLHFTITYSEHLDFGTDGSNLHGEFDLDNSKEFALINDEGDLVVKGLFTGTDEALVADIGATHPELDVEIDGAI